MSQRIGYKKQHRIGGMLHRRAQYCFCCCAGSATGAHTYEGWAFIDAGSNRGGKNDDEHHNKDHPDHEDNTDHEDRYDHEDNPDHGDFRAAGRHIRDPIARRTDTTEAIRLLQVAVDEASSRNSGSDTGDKQRPRTKQVPNSSGPPSS
ncbi:hypothetical protein Trydic_g17596 [Trypoxylus dichotomus]